MTKKSDKKQPWFKFYPQDWRGDAKLRMCSIGARGLWVEMLCVMHEAEPYGHLVIGGKNVSPKQIAALAGLSFSECAKYLVELELAGVCSRTEDTKTIYSRRMVRDKAKADKDRENGKGGGNPKLLSEVNEGVNPQDKAHIPETRIADAADTREPLVSDAARDLADELMVIAGHDIRFTPPGWCGAAMRVHTWLANGWPKEIIISATRAAVGKRRGQPPVNSVQFFEAAIAEEVARQSAPLPIVEIRQPEKRTVTSHGPSQNRPGGSLIASIDRELARIEDEKRADLEVSARPVLRISN